jgi:hypothetical protein
MSSILGLVSSHKQNEADLVSLLSSAISQIAIPTQLVFSASERNDSTESFEMYLEGFEVSCYVLQLLVKCHYETWKSYIDKQRPHDSQDHNITGTLTG